MITRLFLISILFIYSVQIQAIEFKKDSIGLTKINGKFHIRYMVSPGETIYRISNKYKIAVTDLLDLNPELEFGLKTGQIINIPYNPELKTEEKTTVVYPKQDVNKPVETNSDSLTDIGVVHKVQPGETYSSLARKYNLTVEELFTINKIELKAGQKIIVNNKIKAPKKQETTSASQPAVVKKDEPKPIAAAPEPAPKPIKRFEPEEETNNAALEPIEYNNNKMHLLVVPFDPYLYFSDADDEIAANSKIQRTKVRQAFRRRLNALLEPKGYETIHLLGGQAKDSITDLNKIYSSVNYSYQDILFAPNNPRIQKEPEKIGKDKKSNQPTNIGENSRAAQAQDAKKYFGVRISNPDFFTYFNNKYKIDYYLFINQFEVKTNYENCLDRAALNYERGFTIHYSIFNKEGKQISGNRVYIDYNSNVNNINKILADNMQRVADKIMADLPNE
ncbi:MAG: LysM peptidoglycan-binding domain-containing protein [Bacteroidota bacterium]|nr:LysM peptidoglycan-binding domain-containing protein [Bacteroidota bacterium]